MTQKKTTKSKKNRKNGYIVAIDGPAGAGKSTVSRLLASELGGRLLDTGAMYRSVVYLGMKLNLKTAKDFGSLARKLIFDIDSKSQHLTINGEELGLKLRTPQVTEKASLISKFKSVRTTLTQKQRSIGKKWSKLGPVIVEGRDIGTVVFPKVEFKFYVTADEKIRAQRRFGQLKKNHAEGVKLESVLKEQRARDKQDSERTLAPLSCASDAVLVDTSSMSVNQVVHFMKNHILGKLEINS